MFRQAMLVHWKTVRWPLAVLTILAFVLPVGTTAPTARILRVAPLEASYSLNVIRGAAELWLPLFPLLALCAGAVMALSAWYWDHRENHVYALSLPVERWRYAVTKMGAGAVLTLPVFAAFLLGGLLASARLELPAGLETYPVLLTLRFAMATLVAYALLFALAAGTVPTAMRTLVGFAVALVLLLGVLPLLADSFPVLELSSLAGLVSRALTDWPGPFEVFGGSWMLIDV